MSSIKIAALSLAAVLVTAASVQAAPHHKRPMHHRTSHAAMHHRGAPMHSATPMRGGAMGDHSADQLNAQSLARSQNGQ